MASRVKEVPKGFHTATPNLTVTDGAKAIDFYKRAFGAEELFRVDLEDGKIGHAELKIGDSIIMLSDEMPGCTHSPQVLGGHGCGHFPLRQGCGQGFQPGRGGGRQDQYAVE